MVTEGALSVRGMASILSLHRSDFLVTFARRRLVWNVPKQHASSSFTCICPCIHGHCVLVKFSHDKRMHTQQKFDNIVLLIMAFFRSDAT